jgi:hypothetical protein
VQSLHDPYAANAPVHYYSPREHDTFEFFSYDSCKWLLPTLIARSGRVPIMSNRLMYAANSSIVDHRGSASITVADLAAMQSDGKRSMRNRENDSDRANTYTHTYNFHTHCSRRDQARRCWTWVCFPSSMISPSGYAITSLLLHDTTGIELCTVSRRCKAKTTIPPRANQFSCNPLSTIYVLYT